MAPAGGAFTPVHVVDEEQEDQRPRGWVERVGIHPPLLWGFVGVLLFMIGDGVESGYLSPYLHDRGVTPGNVALVFTVYGIAAAIASWCSGALSDLWGPRRVMLLGAGIWIGFEILLLAAGLPGPNYPLILVSYGLRGFGYPLFAFGFLVWITAATPPKRLGTGVGWFWFAFTGGLPTLGSYFASGLIPAIGQYLTFWASLALVVLGAIIALVGVQEPTGTRPLARADQHPLTTLLASLTILWRRPRIGIGTIVRAINTTPEYGFLVFLPLFFTQTIGFSLERWLQLLGFIFLSNIIWNLLFGVIGDKLGWRRTVAFCGGVGSAISTLLLYYVPVATHSYGLSVLVGVLYGATLAGYVPLSALMPSMAPEQRGGAMAALNLGAGASVFVGPAIVGGTLGALGVRGVMWIFAGLYLVSAVLAWFLRTPEGAPAIPGEAAPAEEPAPRGIGRLAYAASGSILGHPPSLPPRLSEGEHNIDAVLFDIGGTIYDDERYVQALYQATRELGGNVDEAEFWAFYDSQRERGDMSLRTAFAQRFTDGDARKLHERIRHHWQYPAEALYPDVKPTLEVLAQQYRLALVANSPPQVREALRRDGLEPLFSAVVLGGVDGPEKPDPGIFQLALQRLDVRAERAVYVGNRLDTDVRGSHRAGLRSVWMLRGEAPPAPTLAQLREPDAVITSLTGLPMALARLAGAPAPSAASARARQATATGQ